MKPQKHHLTRMQTYIILIVILSALLLFILAGIFFLILTKHGANTKQKDYEQVVSQEAEEESNLSLSDSAANAYVKATLLNLRSEANTDCEILAELHEFDPLEIIDELDGWYRVNYSEGETVLEGYVFAKYVTKGTPPHETADKVIYLTFDDGPGEYTQKLLDILDEYDVKVTFFVTNQHKKYIDLIKEESKRGHTVALHTYSHKWEIYKSEEAYFDDLMKISDLVFDQTGKRANILRFPGGSSNKVSINQCEGIMTTLTESVQAKGYHYADWNVSGKDSGKAQTADEVFENVIAGIEKHSTAIVLQHDVKEYSVDAVPKIIEWGLENGYSFKPLTPESPMPHAIVNN